MRDDLLRIHDHALVLTQCASVGSDQKNLRDVIEGAVGQALVLQSECPDHAVNVFRLAGCKNPAIEVGVTTPCERKQLLGSIVFQIVGHREQNHFRSEVLPKAVSHLPKLICQVRANCGAADVNKVEQNDLSFQGSERERLPMVIDY